MVAPQLLELLVKVRILARQPAVLIKREGKQGWVEILV